MHGLHAKQARNKEGRRLDSGRTQTRLQTLSCLRTWVDEERTMKKARAECRMQDRAVISQQYSVLGAAVEGFCCAVC